MSLLELFGDILETMQDHLKCSEITISTDFGTSRNKCRDLKIFEFFDFFSFWIVQNLIIY